MQEDYINYFTNSNIISPIEFVYEVWKPITKKCGDIKEGIYWISTFGRAYSLYKANKYGRENGFLKPHENRNGYLRIELKCEDGSAKAFAIHRIVMIEFCNIINYQSIEVNHKDGNKHNNFIGNLEWVNRSQNIKHSYYTGLNPNAIITIEQADQIGKMLSLKISHKEISNKLNIPLHIIRDISAGNSWRFIYEKYKLEDLKKDMFPAKFSDEDLHKICKYFEENKYKYSTNTSLFRNALKDLFDMEYNDNIGRTMSRILYHQNRKNITDQYNF